MWLIEDCAYGVVGAQYDRAGVGAGPGARVGVDSEAVGRPPTEGSSSTGGLSRSQCDGCADLIGRGTDRAAGSAAKAAKVKLSGTAKVSGVKSKRFSGTGKVKVKLKSSKRLKKAPKVVIKVGKTAKTVKAS